MTNEFKNAWIEFIAFLQNPKDEQKPALTLGIKTQRLFSILTIEFTIVILLSVILMAIDEIGLFDVGSHKADKIIQNAASWQILLFGSLIIPVYEEIIFRSYLRLKHNYPVKFLIFISSITGKENKENFRNLIERKWTTNFKAIFYISAILFGLIHLTNFDYSLKLLAFAPILILPQFVAGLFIGYIRIRLGFIWGIYLHSLHNLALVIIILVLKPTFIV